MTTYIVIRDMSAGNASIGEEWQETAIFSGESTLEEVMKWAEDDDSADHSRKHIQITRPRKEI